MAKLTHACVITRDVDPLTDFYARVLATPPTRSHDDYVEFATEGGALSLYAQARLESDAPGATTPAANRA